MVPVWHYHLGGGLLFYKGCLLECGHLFKEIWYSWDPDTHYQKDIKVAKVIQEPQAVQNSWLARQRACICLAILITGLSVLLPVLMSVHWSLLEKQTGKKMNQLKREIQRENNFTVFCFSIYYKILPYYPVRFWPCQSLTKVSCLRTNLNEILFQIQALWKSK